MHKIAFAFQYGYKTQAKIGNRNVWRLDGYDGLTRVTAVTDGCLQHAERQDIFGRTESVTTWRGTNLADSMTFAYNQYTGNLTSRRGMLPQQETFSYDSLDRLTGVSVGGVQQSSITYEANGNIYSKTDIGGYTYDNAKPHAVTSVENTAGLIDSNDHTIGYNGFGKVSFINNQDFSMSFAYGPDRERWRVAIDIGVTVAPPALTDALLTGHLGVDSPNGGGYTGGVVGPWDKIRTIGKILYAGDYEYYEPMASNKTHRYYYLDGGVLYHKESKENRDELLFMQTDNLGSIRRIYGKAGVTVFEATYDAWGKRTVTKDSIDFRRGYTGHEHLAEFGLINMNGRLYDPLLGRFLSPDPYVQLPDFSQNFNRYSYCLNNPLKYTDPSGEFAWIPVLAIAGGIINAAINIDNINNFGQFLGYFSVGALAGAAGAGLGSISIGIGGAIGGAAVGAISGSATGLLLGAGNALVGGNNILKSALQGLLWGGISGAAIGGIVGGISSLNSGENFWTGKQKNIVYPKHSSAKTLPDNIPTKAPTDTKALRNAANYSTESTTDIYYEVITYSGKQEYIPNIENSVTTFKRPQVIGYLDDIEGKTDIYHNFPYSFDKQIIEKGFIFPSSGNSSMFYAPGFVNGVQGYYTIGINTTNGIIYHRCFYSIDSWGKFHFP